MKCKKGDCLNRAIKCKKCKDLSEYVSCEDHKIYCGNIYPKATPEFIKVMRVK
jgi:hypothetical protein